MTTPTVPAGLRRRASSTSSLDALSILPTGGNPFADSILASPAPSTHSTPSTPGGSHASPKRKPVPSVLPPGADKVAAAANSGASLAPARPRLVRVTSDDGTMDTLNFSRRPSEIAAPAPAASANAVPGATPVAEKRRPAPISTSRTLYRSPHPLGPTTPLTPQTASLPPSYSSPGTSPASAAGPKPPPALAAMRGIRVGRVEPTRAPVDSFASVEMMQGQRDYDDRSRGREAWGAGGRYEGRAAVGAPAYARQDPLEAVRNAREQGKPTEEQIAGGERRGSADTDAEWRKRFGSLSQQGAASDEKTNKQTGYVENKNFSFPMKSPALSISSQSPRSAGFLPPYAVGGTTAEEDADLGMYSTGLNEKSVFADVNYSTDRLVGGGWQTEYIGGGGDSPASQANAFNSHRPSIVALPQYPAPSGSLARSKTYRLKKAAHKLAYLTVLLWTAAAAYYLVQRIENLHAVERRHPGKWISAWTFLVVESITMIIMAVHSLSTVFSYRLPGSGPTLRLRGDSNLPTVDVFIVSSGQQDAVTLDSAIAAANMDYPQHKFRVMVLDPTGSGELQRKLTSHGKGQQVAHLSYHRRALHSSRGDIHHSKANSVNFGMMEAKTMGARGAGEFILVFDADMMPERNFLRAILPSLVSDSKVALVTAPAGFINLPVRQSHPLATLMEASEGAFTARSGFAVRRSALEQIGGFPADSWLQDGQVSALLQGRGYKCAEIEEVLQYGMAKPTYGAQVGGMMTNGLGPLRTAARLSFFLGGEKVALMPKMARFTGLVRAAYPIFAIIFLALQFLQPFMFTYGGITVLTPNVNELNSLLLYTLIMVGTSRLHDLVWSWSTGLSSPHQKMQIWLFAAPYHGVSLLRLILPSWLGGYSRGSDININRVAVVERPSFWKRLGWFVVDPHAGVLVSFLSSIGLSIWRLNRDFQRGTVDVHQTTLMLVLTVAWPSMLWLEVFFASMVPLTCLLFPSRLLTEPRESFLIRDHFSSVARPKHSFKSAQPFKVQRGPEVLTGFLVVAWSAVAFALGQLTNLYA